MAYCTYNLEYCKLKFVKKISIPKKRKHQTRVCKGMQERLEGPRCGTPIVRTVSLLVVVADWADGPGSTSARPRLSGTVRTRAPP